MRAAVVTRFGGPEVFELAELPDPFPGPGKVAIDGLLLPGASRASQPAARGAINAISQGLVDIRTQVFPLAEAAAAQRRAETGPVAGRILLAP